jgi:hypothetical protein
MDRQASLALELVALALVIANIAAWAAILGGHWQ